MSRVQETIGQVVEGIPTTYALHDLSRKLGVEMPVTEAVYDVLERGVSPVECVGSLMGREVTSEAGQDIMSLIMQIRQSATKTARRTARSCCPEGDGGEPPSAAPCRLGWHRTSASSLLSRPASPDDAAAGVAGLETLW